MEKSIIQDQKLKKNKMHTTENAIEKINNTDFKAINPDGCFP